MSELRLGLLALTAFIPLTANADVSAGDLPAGTIWYMHADLDAMRTSEAGSKVYEWFEGEVVVEVKDEVGIDIDKEVDSFTAFANNDDGTVIIVDGQLTKETQDKLLALAAKQGPVDPREYKGQTYYFFGNEDDIDDNRDNPFEDLEDAVFVSFAVKGKALITGTAEQMQGLLDNKGEVSGSGSHDGALLVLSANKSFVQAGMQTEGLMDDDDGDDWESNIVRNTEQAALLMADESGQIAIEAQLVSTDPKMAEAIGGIVNGLIALQAFNSELGPEIQSLIRNTKIDVAGKILSINMVIDPDLVTTVLSD
jgi:hypothetical protein